MVVFSSRPTGYKVGFLALLAFTGLYIVAFGAPYWGKAYYGDATIGLWMMCTNGDCVNLDISNLAGWFHFVRAVETIGLILLVPSCLYGLYANLRSEPGSHSRLVERLAISGSLISLSGVIVFFVLRHGEVIFGWAIYMSTVSSAVIFICFFIIYRNNPPPEIIQGTVISTAPQAVVTMSTVQGGGVVAGGMGPGGPQAGYHPIAPQQGYGAPAPQVGLSTQYTYG